MTKQFKEPFAEVFVAMVETKRRLFQVQLKGVFGHALKLLEAGSGETLKGFDAIDVRAP